MTASMQAVLTLVQARKIADDVVQKARDLSLLPITVAVLDSGGHAVVVLREDGASIMRPQIAIGKAHTALSLGMSSRQLAEVAAARPQFVASLGPVSAHGIIPAAGGMLITIGGSVVGAVGVSGDTPDNDEICAGHALEQFAEIDAG